MASGQMGEIMITIMREAQRYLEIYYSEKGCESKLRWGIKWIWRVLDLVD